MDGKERVLCKRCVLPEYSPYIRLDENDMCSICADFDRNRSQSGRDYSALELELNKILQKFRGKGHYDCMVMCSGGKDSTFSLYYMKKKYRMNPLTVTFDHGFENGEAVDNIKNAVDILGVDWIYYKTDFMKDIFARIVNSGTSAPMCHVCAIWYIRFVTDLAARYRIPLIVAGWTRGQVARGEELGNEYRPMSEATEDFIKKHLRTQDTYKDFPLSIQEALRQADRKFKTSIISPHWYLKKTPAEIKTILEKELKWRAPSLSYPADSTNCMMNFASVYLTMKHFGYTHYHIELSKLIRLGELNRDDALKMLEINFDEKFINSIIAKAGCSLRG